MPDDGNLDRYQLTGLVICGLCGRRAEGHWAHGRARYRCRHGYTSASDAQIGRPKTLYLREDQLIEQARAQLASIGAVADDIGPTSLAAQLRGRGITIVCTPVSITLDPGLDVPEPEAGQACSTVDHEDETGQLAIPDLVVPRPRQATKNPHRRHPRDVNTFGWG